MKVKEIIFLILIVTAGVFFYYVQTGKLHIYFDVDEGLVFTTEEEFIFEESQEITPPFPAELRIINSHGDIEIYGTEENTITIFFQKSIWRKNEEQAIEISEELRMTIDQDADQISISTNRDEFGKRNFRTNFRVTLPQEMDIELENSHGLTKVTDIRNAKIKNRHGKVITSDIEGKLSIQNSNKDVEVDNIQSDVDLESEYSKVLIKNIKGVTKISNKHGKIELKNISQKVEIVGPYTEIFVQQLSGEVEVENSYRKITLFDIGPAIIKGDHSSIEVDKAEGNVKINNNYGKVKINDIDGNLFIEGKSLAVSGKEIDGEKISVSTSYQDIDLTQFSGETTIVSYRGDIVLEPVLISYPIRVNNEYGAIQFYWPQGAKHPLEARARNGEIKWKLPVELSFWDENHTSVIKAFLEDSGKPSVFLATTYGDILIEED